MIRESRMKQQKEADITRAIRSLLKSLGVFHWKQWQGSFSQPKGVSDILGIFEGKPLAIEVKTKTGKISPAQEMFLKRWREAGGIGFVARSVDDVIDGLGVRDRFLF